MGFYYAAVFAAFLLPILLIFVPIYIIAGIALSTIAQRRGMENPWLAWVPIGQFYIIGAIVKELDFGGSFKIPKMELLLPLGFIAAFLFGLIPYIGFLFWIAYGVLFVYSLYILYKMYDQDKAVLYTVLSIFWLIPLLLIRNNTPVEM